MHAERVLALLDQAVALLGDDRRDQDLAGCEAHCRLLLFLRRPTGVAGTRLERPRARPARRAASAPRRRRRPRARPARRRRPAARLRNDCARLSSSSAQTTTSGQLLAPRPRRARAAVFVEASRPAGAVDQSEGPCLRVSSERAAKRGAAGLAVDLDLEAAHRRREGDAAARPVRGARRAGAGAAGALLAPRLRAAAGDEPAALGAARAGALGVQLGAHGLVHEMRLHVGAEHRRRRARPASRPCRRRPGAGPCGLKRCGGGGHGPSPP